MPPIVICAEAVVVIVVEDTIVDPDKQSLKPVIQSVRLLNLLINSEMIQSKVIECLVSITTALWAVFNNPFTPHKCL